MQLQYPSSLPIVAVKGEIVQAIQDHQVVIIAGETGSGKTTQLPKMCLEAGRGRAGMIGCTQPRRIAAVSIAGRVAEELGPSGAGLVGHKVRFRDRTCEATRIKFMTDGILLAELGHDRNLTAYDTIIVDEAHERSLNIDFLLGVLRQLLPRRADLKVIITSATIDTAKFAKHFRDAPVLSVSGRTFPVEVRYSPPDNGEDDGDYIHQAVAAVREICRDRQPGDILVFMPTERDIRETVELLGREPAAREALTILPLFGRMAARDQQRIFRQTRGRKIVVASNVAETSITVPGIRYVVDTGLARISRYTPRAGTTKMPVTRISQASCEQRKGRCGRLGPGLCVRLYSEEDFHNRPAYTPPEILRANLAEVILRMLAQGLGEPASFPFIDPPSSRAIKDGYALLQELGAIRQPSRGRGWRLSKQGRMMARLPLDPRLSRMIIEARKRECLKEVVVIAAALSIQDPRVRPAEQERKADAAHAVFAVSGSDFLGFLHIWKAFAALMQQRAGQGALRRFCRNNFLAWQRMREWRDIVDQISGELRRHKGYGQNRRDAHPDQIHQAILSGSLRQIAQRREKNIYQAARDRQCMLFPGSTLFGKGGEWIMAAELVETSRLFARCAATIKPEWIEPLAAGLCRSSYSAPHWAKKRGQVVAHEKVTLFGLVIVPRRTVNYGRINPEEARQIFIQSALVEGELGGRFAFFRRNQALLRELEEVEDRLRVRDMVVDDSVLYQFYDRRLPAAVVDRTTLLQFIKKTGNDRSLILRRRDVIAQSPDRKALEQYPRTLEVGEISLPLSYLFQPGDAADGVTVEIPAAAMAGLAAERFEWLVPGLLREKVLFLLKGLPKGVRKQLIPVADTADWLVRTLPFGQGSLYSAMERLIRERYGVVVARREWPRQHLPDHLRMRFVLRQGERREVTISRDFAALGRPRADVGLADQLRRLQRRHGRQGLTQCDLDDLRQPLTLQDDHGRFLGHAHPALRKNSEGRIDLILVADAEKARQLNQQGLLGLYRIQFQDQWPRVVRELALSRNQWPLYEGLAGHEEINRRLSCFILGEVFAVASGRIPTQAAFDARVAAIKKRGLAGCCRELLGQVLAVLESRRQTLNQISSYYDKMHHSMRPQLERFRQLVAELVPPDFLQAAPALELTTIPRYLQAVEIRLTRWYQDPAKDARKEAQLGRHPERLRKASAAPGLPPEAEPLLATYRQMVEEYRVSVFAQELKTAIPVSAKRLEEQWRKLAAFLP